MQANAGEKDYTKPPKGNDVPTPVYPTWLSESASEIKLGKQ